VNAATLQKHNNHKHNNGDNPSFSLADLEGEIHTLPDYHGKIVLVNFWASWCPPCIYEMPKLKKLKQHFANRPFEILTINVGEKKFKVRKFSKLIKLDLPVLLDTSRTTFTQWGVKTIPTSFLLDENTNILYTVRGDPGWNEEEIHSIIEKMLPQEKQADIRSVIPESHKQ